jgi:hypothetical protein
LQEEEEEKEEAVSKNEIDCDAIDTIDTIYTLTYLDQNEEQFVSQMHVRCTEKYQTGGRTFHDARPRQATTTSCAKQTKQTCEEE